MGTNKKSYEGTKTKKENRYSSNGKRHSSVKRSGDHKTKSSEPVAKCTGKLEDVHSNDINWWNRSPIFNDATSIQMTRIPGYVYDGVEEGMSGIAADPSVMTIDYSPTIGVSSDYNSPINRGFTSLFAEIVAHTNSSNLGFTQASLAMLAVSAMDVIANIASAKRAYGLRNLYLNSNANFPRVLYKACGFNDYEVVDWENIRARMNTIIMDFNSLMIPKYISLYERYFQLPFNIYADEPGLGGSFYIFKPVTYYVYSDVENKAVAKDLDVTTLSGLLNVIEEQLRALRSTSDLGLIMGAYRRAFPESEVVKLDLLDIGFLTTPWYDRNMTWQINNMSLIKKSAINLDSLSISEDVVNDLIICEPACSAALSATSRVDFTNTTARWTPSGDDADTYCVRLNSFDGTTGAEWIMESSRLLVGTLADVERDMLLIYTVGTEICHAATVYNSYINSDGELAINASTVNTCIGGGSTVQTVYGTLYNVTKFRNHIPVDITIGYTDQLPEFYDLRDFYVTTTLSVYELEQINRAALQSAFLVNIPLTWNK